jgi:hypothetical protein
MHISTCYNEIHCFIQLIYTNKEHRRETIREDEGDQQEGKRRVRKKKRGRM